MLASCDMAGSGSYDSIRKHNAGAQGREITTSVSNLFRGVPTQEHCTAYELDKGFRIETDALILPPWLLIAIISN